MRMVNRAGHEVDVPDDDVIEINQYKARGYGSAEAIAINKAFDEQVEADRGKELEVDAKQAKLDAAAQAAGDEKARQAEADAAEAAEQAALGYHGKKWTVEALRDEIRTRNEQRLEEHHLAVSGSKSELIAALEADDQGPPADDNQGDQQ